MISVLKKSAWSLVVYTVFVILWGAWVRISHSGDGCGQSWPLCDGALFPKTLASEQWIEYFHRFTSGLYGLVVIALYFVIRKSYEKQSAQRLAATATLTLMIVEAGLGAALVLKGLVGENATVFRLIVMTLHQLNSLMLVASTVILAILITPQSVFSVRWRGLFLHRGLLLILMTVAATGAWAALSNTLFPSTSLLSGLAQDFDSANPWILKLRILHPIFASILCVFLSYFFWLRGNTRLTLVFVGALVIGLTTLLSLSPVAMKLLHLGFTQGLWILMVHYVMTSLLSTSR